MKFINRTDLACEITSKRRAGGVTIEESLLYNLPVTRISIDGSEAKRIGKAEGEYITLFCKGFDEGDEKKALTDILSELVPKRGRVLVAGLGNENITPDSLGVRTISGVMATAHFSSEREFSELGMREVYVVETGVLAQTGLESAAQIKYIANGISPDCIIAVDSLACSEMERLCNTVQVTNTGIAPGSGVKNMRAELSQRTLGVPVIAVGVPTVIDLKSIAKTDAGETCMVVPRDIDMVIRRYSNVIAGAVNKTLNPSLSDDEIEKLLM